MRQISKQMAANAMDKKTHSQQGFALPLAMGLGFVMLILGMTTVLVSQQSRTAAWQRRDSGAGLAVAEGGMARTLAQFSDPKNALLLNRNYDTINPDTGTTYLGPDGILDSGDEENSAIDEWTGYDPSSMPCHQLKDWGIPNFTTTGSMGNTGTYNLRAYRFDPQKQTGTFFVEASRDGSTMGVVITISVKPDLSEFPGIALVEPVGDPDWIAGILALRGREISGTYSNIYYHPAGSADPSLTGSAALGDHDRDSYLNAIWSSVGADGAAGDTVEGEIFACTLRPLIPKDLPTTVSGTFDSTSSSSGTAFVECIEEICTKHLEPATGSGHSNTINSSTTLMGQGGGVPTLYQIDTIDLSSNHTLSVDTTHGPVWIELINGGGKEEVGISLRDTAKILNIRTDGRSPRVGDLRIMARQSDQIALYDQTCIQDAFLWFPYDELRLLTTGPGCPSGRNTNIESVVWMEAILSSKNETTHRDVAYLDKGGENYDTSTKTGVTSGIFVPEDMSSLNDLLPYINWPVRYQFGGVQQWQRVRK